MSFSRSRRSGQSLIEACIVIGLICLLFFGMFQLAQVFVAKEVLNYAAGCGARARTVGFNEFMVWKTVKVGSIPNAGLMVSPAFTPTPPAWGTSTPAELWATWSNALLSAPASEQCVIELSRIPLYLGADSRSWLPPILDYADWSTVADPETLEDPVTGMLRVRAKQKFPLRLPMHGAFYADDSVPLKGEMKMENHYPLYLE